MNTMGCVGQEGLGLWRTAIAVALCFNIVVSSDGAEARSRVLFWDVPNGVAADLRGRPTEKRNRRVKVDLAALGGGALPQGASSVALNLFADTELEAVKSRFERRGSRGFTWFGKVQGDPMSSVVLTTGEGLIQGLVFAHGRHFEIRGASASAQEVVEIDQSAFPPEGCDQIPAGDQTQFHPLFSPTQDARSDSGAVIDVLVVYTPAARIAQGGTAAIQLLAQNAVDTTNDAYFKSLVAPRLSLVHAAEVSYTENVDTSAGWDLDLNRLAGTSDGFMDNVHALRDTYKADVVLLLVRDGGPYCGIAAAIMANTSTAFGMVARSCATSNYTFAHEIGHLQGARHDMFVDSTLGSPYDYNHGHVNLANRQRTVMASNDECSKTTPGTSCTRVPYLSNPGVNYPLTSVPTGTALRENNALVLNNTASTVANFRQSTRTLTVQSTYPAVGVPITVSPVDTGGLGSGSTSLVRTYASGSTVTLTAPLAADGNPFSSWTGCTSTSSTFGEICTTTVDTDKTVIANYARDLSSRPVATALWSSPDTGQAMIRELDPDTNVLQNALWLHSPTGVGPPWKATSYSRVDDSTAYVLWTRSDVGRASLWKVNPALASGTPLVIPIESAAYLYSSTGVGAQWQATSYEHVSTGEGYVLWTRSDVGKASLWRINPGELGTLPVLPVAAAAYLYSATGVGAPWQATSYERVNADEGHVLWTRSDVGRASLWRINPGGLGILPVLPVVSAAYLYSSAGVGGPWHATSYEHVSAGEGYVLWTRSDLGRASLWRIDPGGLGTLPVIPILDSGYLPPSSGAGSQWLANGYER